jgi:hypothetical protein
MGTTENDFTTRELGFHLPAGMPARNLEYAIYERA